MKASELKKKSIDLAYIYKEIYQANDRGDYKYFIPHFVFIEESVKLKLIDDGFKVYKGEWDGVINNALIIEW